MIRPGSMTDTSTKSDAELARTARAGSPDAFDELIHRHHHGVFGFLVSLTRHRQDAEDLTQQTFVRAWRKIRHYDPARPLRPWLLTIARRESIAALRRKRPIPNPNPVDNHQDPWQAAPDDEPARRLWALAARHLSDDARAALWLHYHDELQLDQVADILGKRTGAVKTMLHRARRTLAEAAANSSEIPPPVPPPPLPGQRKPPPPSAAEIAGPPPLPDQLTTIAS